MIVETGDLRLVQRAAVVERGDVPLPVHVTDVHVVVGGVDAVALVVQVGHQTQSRTADLLQEDRC